MADISSSSLEKNADGKVYDKETWKDRDIDSWNIRDNTYSTIQHILIYL